MKGSRLIPVVGAAAAAAVLLSPITAPSVNAQQPVTVRTVRTPDGYRFQPASITVPIGTTVVWPVEANDPFPHTVNSDGDGPLNSGGRLTAGQQYSFTFTQPGTYNYICQVHIAQGQRGTVVVTAGQIPAGAAPAAQAPAAQVGLPQFGAATTTAWPPVFSGELQVTVGRNTAVVGLVGNRTSDQHAFVDVRWALPTAVTVVDSYANTPGVRGKQEGLSADAQQVGWVNHFVRAGQVQGPFYLILENAGRTFRTYSWMWFQTGGELGSARNQRNGNYTSSGVVAGNAPFTWSGEFASAAGAAGATGVPAPAAPAAPAAGAR